MIDFVCPCCRSPAEIKDYFPLGGGESTYIIECTSDSCAVSRPMRISLSGNRSVARAATLAEIFLHLREGVMI
ncbi:MAG: hypothetical protein JRN68_04740 [Nitrososphaerota archaeon]|nr:hypothetical protein [Nitrososphaerota archaeon]